MVTAWRSVAFGAGVAAGVVCLIAVMACLLVRFPMIPAPQGHYLVNPRRDLVMTIALFTGVLTVVLAMFGTGLRRMFLAGGGLVLLGLWYSAWMLRF
ncbi:MAG TPA: hypothetical protein VHE33_12185 [Acidobacteriaceae bacterium]|nr:hypothetical protein [Acidobacteriaceae bacterium]